MTATVCWAVKGGSGTTVVAACLALASPTPRLLVDLDGELPAALGIPEPAGQGLCDWFATDLPASAIGELAIDLDATTRLVPRGAAPLPAAPERWAALADWAATCPLEPILDAGTGTVPPALATAAAGVRLTLVTRLCYLALRRAAGADPRPDDVIVVAEPGRALHARDVEQAIGAPVVATLTVDPAVARAVDAGLLAARVPRAALRAFQAQPAAPTRRPEPAPRLRLARR